MGTQRNKPNDFDEQPTDPFRDALLNTERCAWCCDQLARIDDLCVWCTALRHAARFVSIMALEQALSAKRRGLI